MKTKFFTFIFLFLAAVPMWAYRDFMDVKNVAKTQTTGEILQSGGNHTNDYIRVSATEIAPKTAAVKLYFGTTLQWSNARHKDGAYWYAFSFGVFELEYTLYYRYNGGNWIQYKTVSKEIKSIDRTLPTQYECTAGKVFSTFNELTYNAAFSEDFKLDKGFQAGTYEFKVKFVTYASTKSPVSNIVDGSHYEDGSISLSSSKKAMDYVGKVHYTTESASANGIKAKMLCINSDRAIINGNLGVNPLSDDNYYLVYNHPDAEFDLSLLKVNVPADTILNNYRYYGYVNFLVGMGVTSSLPTTSNVPIVKLVEDPKIDEYVSQRVYQSMITSPGFSPVWSRPQNLLLQTMNSSATRFNDVAITKLSDLANLFDCWFNRTYHVRDLQFAVANGSLPQNNEMFKIWAKLHYDKQESLPDCLVGMGICHQYNLSQYRQMFGSNTNAPYDFPSQNTLTFKLLPQASFPSLESFEKQEHRICVSDGLKIAELTESDIIHLHGKSIDCESYSLSYYQPEYSWEMSTDGSTWEEIASDNRYRLYRENLSFYPVMDTKKDLLLNASILKGKQVLYFRQRAVLKAFSSKNYSDLYRHYDEESGLYYIVVESNDYQTYRPNPAALKENFVFIGDFEPNLSLCYGESPANTFIQFGLKSDENLSAEDVQQLETIADYRVWRLADDADEVVEQVSDRATYSVPFHLGQTSRYRAVIAFCHDSLYQDVNWVSSPLETLSVGQILSENAQIVRRDSLNSTVTMMCLRGVAPRIALDGEKRGFRYECRTEDTEWTEFTEPALYATTLATAPTAGMRQFFVRKRNAMGCYSDSLRLVVNYFDGITDNHIRFKDAPTSDTLYISMGAAFPEIHGNLVSGGYGIPTVSNDYSYTYQWIHRVGEQWQVIDHARITDDGSVSVTSSTPYVSLSNYTHNGSDCAYIARVVYSRSAMNLLTQVVDTSNVLCVKVEPSLVIEDLQVYDGLCAGEDVVIRMKSTIDNDRYVYRYSLSGSEQVTESAVLPDGTYQILIKSPKRDFSVYLYRENLLSGSRSDVQEIPIEVKSLDVDFAINVEGVLRMRNENRIDVNAGERVQLVNLTYGANRFEWILQVQQNEFGEDTYAARSERHDPVCYLYNPGNHRFLLTATNEAGCSVTVSADNVYVSGGASLRRSFFVEEEQEDFWHPLGSCDEIAVFPTLLQHNQQSVLHCKANLDDYTVMLFNVAGQPVLEKRHCTGDITVDCSGLSAGLYLLLANGKQFKIIIR